MKRVSERAYRHPKWYDPPRVTDWSKIPLETMREIFGEGVGDLFHRNIHNPRPIDPNMKLVTWDAENNCWRWPDERPHSTGNRRCH